MTYEFMFILKRELKKFLAEGWEISRAQPRAGLHSPMYSWMIMRREVKDD